MISRIAGHLAMELRVGTVSTKRSGPIKIHSAGTGKAVQNFFWAEMKHKAEGIMQGSLLRNIGVLCGCFGGA